MAESQGGWDEKKETKTNSSSAVSNPRPACDQRIRSPHPNDVLCGRGRRFNLRHPGNKRFRKMVLERKEEYCVTTDRKVKAEIAQDILNQIASLEPPGRFLLKDEDNPADHGRVLTNGDGDWLGCWIVATESWAVIKTSQALREGAPNLRLKAERIPAMRNKKRSFEDELPIDEVNETDSQVNFSPNEESANLEMTKQNKSKNVKITKGDLKAEAVKPEPRRENQSPETSDEVMVEFMRSMFARKEPPQEGTFKSTSKLHNVYQSQHQNQVDQTSKHFSQNQHTVLSLEQKHTFQQHNYDRHEVSVPTKRTQPLQSLTTEEVSKPSFQGRTYTTDIPLNQGHQNHPTGVLQAKRGCKGKETVPEGFQNNSQGKYQEEDTKSKEQQISSIKIHKNNKERAVAEDHKKKSSQSRVRESLGTKCICGLWKVGIDCGCALGLDDDFVSPFDDN